MAYIPISLSREAAEFSGENNLHTKTIIANKGRFEKLAILWGQINYQHFTTKLESFTSWDVVARWNLQRVVLVNKSLSSSSLAYLTEKQGQQFYPTVAQAKDLPFSPEAKRERKWGYCFCRKERPSTHIYNHNNMARNCKHNSITFQEPKSLSSFADYRTECNIHKTRDHFGTKGMEMGQATRAFWGYYFRITVEKSALSVMFWWDFQKDKS